MADGWDRKIAAFAKVKREDCSEVDKDLQAIAMSGRYGYEQPDNDIPYRDKSKIYQSYNQEYVEPTSGATSSEDASPLVSFIQGSSI